jgi:hypothetical protein
MYILYTACAEIKKKNNSGAKGLRIWWPNIISNKDLWRVTDQEDINLEIKKRKFRWIGHTLRKEDGEVSKAALLWNPQGNRKRGAGENRSSRKRVEAGTN